MKADTRVRLIASLLMVGFLAGSVLLSTRINASIGRHKLTYADRSEDGDPPQVALGIAMGAFRGIFVNFLWIRANDLKEAGKYYEAIELSKAITKLQPRFPRVWVFHAWNMAYNISVTTQTPEERWQWVLAGIRLLRDQGIPANPNDLLIHKELAWIFLHKVQGNSDDANPFYKRMMAQEWTVALGPPPSPDAKIRTREQATDQFAAWLQTIVDAPDSLEAVEEDDPSVKTLVERLQKDVGDPIGVELLRRYELNRSIRSSVRSGAMDRAIGAKTVAFRALVDDPAFAAAWPKLLNHVRRRVVIDVYHMEPERMLRYTRKYGPLDWRHPAAHAVYWAARGVEEALTRFNDKNASDFDFVNTDRIVIQGIQELARSGDLFANFLDLTTRPRDCAFLQAPNPNFVQTYGDVLGELVERSWADTDKRAYSFYSAGYENFLRDFIRYFYRRGQKDIASELYRKLRTFPGQNLNDPDRSIELSKPLEEFVMDELKDRQNSPDVAKQEVVGSLQGAFLNGLLAGDDDLFQQQVEYAKLSHRYFFEQQYRITGVSPTVARMEQMDASFPVVAGQVFAEVAASLDVDEAQLMFIRAPDGLRVYAYDLMQQRFREELDRGAAAGGKKFDEVFPQPAGLEEHRKFMADRLERRNRQRLNVEQK